MAKGGRGGFGNFKVIFLPSSKVMI